MSEYNIQMNKYNALNAEYDQLYPVTKIEDVNGLGTALQNKLGGIESTNYPGCYYRTIDGAVEWFNPPMLISKEYRTTERWNGEPVYTMLVDCGSDTVTDTATSRFVDIATCDSLGSNFKVISCVGFQYISYLDVRTLPIINTNLTVNVRAGNRTDSQGVRQFGINVVSFPYTEPYRIYAKIKYVK